MSAAPPEPLGSCQIIDLPVVSDPRGDLTFIEGSRHVPFDIARVYYLYNVPAESSRGGHAHRKLKQVLFALSGSFRVTIDDGTDRQDYWLRTPRQGLLIQNYVWREMDAFSQGAVCMVLASAPFDEADYIRSYSEFRAEISAA
jgi:hypothetical protein